MNRACFGVAGLGWFFEKLGRGGGAVGLGWRRVRVGPSKNLFEEVEVFGVHSYGGLLADGGARNSAALGSPT